MSNNTLSLPREQRLRGRNSVSTLFNEGRSGFVYPVRYVWIESSEEESTPPSVLFNVPKRFHRRANKRNLLRRRIKEAYRLERHLLNIEGLPTLHMALIYSSKEELPYSNIARSIKRILTQINDERATAATIARKIEE